MTSNSILFDQSDGGATLAHEAPACFSDLHLDQVVDAITAGREEYDLKPYFATPLHDVAVVEFRHAVLRDLEQEATHASVTTFAGAMRRMRQCLAQANKLHYKYQQERWFLDAVAVYCDAARTLAEHLADLPLHARGFQALRDHLTSYTASAGFRALAAEVRTLQDDLAHVRYRVQIRGNRVTVSAYAEEADYSAAVEATFARFQQGAVKDYRVKFADPPDMNHVEARVLELVARLFPAVFQALGQFRAKHRHYLDDTLRTFDREVQFYLTYLDYIARLKVAGLSFCYPEVSTQSKEVSAQQTFDLALAGTLGLRMPPAAPAPPIVPNDFALRNPERIVVVTGPNQGGKTTFARLFGQLHYLASLGLPVPGSAAQLFLPDQIFTHFEREEELANLRGKLEDELVRIHAILGQATGNSILVLNESFASTTLHDARFLGTQVLRQISARGALCVYVTFIDELTTLSEKTVSMVSTVDPANPAVRTFKIIRQPANGLAYAAAIAEKYGLSYPALTRRLAGRSMAP